MKTSEIFHPRQEWSVPSYVPIIYMSYREKYIIVENLVHSLEHILLILAFHFLWAILQLSKLQITDSNAK